MAGENGSSGAHGGRSGRSVNENEGGGGGGGALFNGALPAERSPGIQRAAGAKFSLL